MNVLVYAFREGSEHHQQYLDWLTDLVSGADELALCDVVLSGFVRVVTHQRICQPPAPTDLALAFVNDLHRARRVTSLAPSDAMWEQFGRLVQADRGIRGNLVPDAYLAAIAIAHGARLATADRGFARFTDLRWFDPVAPA